jgi:hypothetical protein
MRFKSIILIMAGVVLLMALSTSAAFAGRRIGDCNNDAGVNVGDVVYLINYLYKGGDAPSPKCVGDCNVDCSVNVGDVVFLVNYLYKHGDPPGTPSGGTQKGMVYGYITYTHLKGGVPGVKVWSSASPCTTFSSPLDTMAQSEYGLSCVDPGSQTIHCKDPNDTYSSEPTGTVTVVAGELVKLDLALYPTANYLITATQNIHICGDPGSSYLWGITDFHWKRCCRRYIIEGSISVADGQTLVVDPGMIIYANVQDPITTLCVQQGGKMIADGTPYMPIIFTSLGDTLTGIRRSGDWGGLLIAGYAQNNMGCNWSEGNAVWFGTNCSAPCASHPVDNHDNSGIYRYLICEWAGYWFWVNNELNGIAWYCVGDGTTIDHIEVHRAYDDGMEMFGGTETMKYVVCSENNDDEFDYTDGFAGRAQFVFLRHYGGAYPYFPCCNNGPLKFGDHMIEGDNQETNFDQGPVRSQPLLLNVTSIGPREVHRDSASSSTFNRTQNILLRHGTSARIYNLICMGGKSTGLQVHKTTWQAWDTTGQGANPGYWPYGSIRRDSLDVDYAIFYDNGDGGIYHWNDNHATIFPWHSGSYSALADSQVFDAVMLCDPGLPHTGTSDPWKLKGYYQDPKYNHSSDPGIRKILADDGTGIYNPMLWRPGQATEVDGRMDARPLPGSPALNSANALPMGDPVYADPFFQYVPYVGAFNVCDSTNHVHDWTWPWCEYPDQ